MAKLFGTWPYALAAGLLIYLAGTLAWKITTTAYDVHPDERDHMDAFCYFQVRAWMPPVNTAGLDYGMYGVNRVYSGEVVYWLYGRAAAVASGAHLWPGPAISPEADLGAQIAQCKPGFRAYRRLNVALLVGTLGLLLVVGAWQPWAAAIALGLVCLPQVIYTYSYANSDAWALTWSLALLVFALAEPRPLSSPAKALLLGLLAGLVLLAKPTVWIALPVALAVIGYRLWRGRRDGTALGTIARHTTLGAALCLLLLAPTTLIYPWSQGGHLREQLLRVEDLRAQPGHQPSHPTAPQFELRAQGAGFEQIALNGDWWATSVKSFYGLFGYLNVPSPDWVYAAALAIAVANALLSLPVAWRHWPALPDSLRLMFGLGPAVIAVVVVASMVNSWTNDYQPQGRYLFAAIAPLALWLWALLPWERPWLRVVRLGSAGLLVALSLWVLQTKVL